MKHRLYIDEVGNHALNNTKDVNARFLSLTGVLVSLNHVRDVLFPEMEKMKGDHFNSHPDNPLVLHRKELVNKNAPFEILRDEAVCAAFDADFLAALERWSYKVFSVCLDKQAHIARYGAMVHHPYHYCLEVIVEKCVKCLNNTGHTADVMIEARGKAQDRELAAAFSDIFKRGTRFVSAAEVQKALTSGEIKFRDKKANIAGLQLADLIAHPSRNQILNENGVDIKIAPFASEIIKRIDEKYDGYKGSKFGKKFI